jgi:hypothetical protein
VGQRKSGFWDILGQTEFRVLYKMGQNFSGQNPFCTFFNASFRKELLRNGGPARLPLIQG